MSRPVLQAANAASAMYLILKAYNWTQIALVVDMNYAANLQAHLQLYTGELVGIDQLE